ncbi:type II toxin-antitoxin system HipA family toxin [Leucobacter chromiireducens]|uniref:type II toxin-antitoxin system HipA family toxin n=1 Tax=Leucobacter chromiireducens TaxID=283877 RepID=UPI000F638A94|nr:type II toxin-antitoxin system HipA family toxin [Leucobacter chromiireducens]
MTFTRVDVLEVRAWGETVGALSSGRGGVAAFEYAPGWRDRELAPLLMPTTPRGRIWTFPELPRETFHGLPPLIADAAPDRFGNSVIAAALARQGILPSEVRPIDRLAYVGERALGALTFHPAQSPGDAASSLELAQLVEAARAAVHGSLDPDARTTAVNDLLQVGSSAGGARPKAIIAWNRESNELRAGGIAAPPGFEQWLLKFDGVGADAQLGTTGEYGRTEYAYARMAGAAGIDMAECRLLEEGGRAHFMTRRFDRPGTDGDRLHMQSLCALAGADFNALGTHDYATLFLVAEELGIDAGEQLFRRACFNVIAANNDDHTKNHAFTMTRDGVWQLSPAYDLTFAYSPTSVWLRQHLMSVNGRFERITERDLLTLADQFGVPGARGILAEVADAVARWPEFAAASGISAARVAEVGARLAEVRAELG